MNWKQNIDDSVKKTKKNEEDRKLREGQAAQEEYEKKLRAHKLKFKCHVKGCMTVSQVPAEIGNGTGHSEITLFSDDWSRPGDLEKCKNCQQYTCPEHLHIGICKTCAEKL